MIEIGTYSTCDKESVIALVLHCQNDGTRPLVGVEDQSDLLHIEEEYIYDGGNFWVAKESGKVVGTIGLMNAGNGVVILKKFFVYEPYRSFPHNLGRQLYAIFLDFAQKHNFREIILDTPRNTDRVYRFYEKAGFRKISQEKFPIIYDYLYRDSDFSY